MRGNSATHTIINSVNASAEIFGEEVISQGLWPAGSPTLHYYNFYGAFKNGRCA
jgi:hypothetical protein